MYGNGVMIGMMKIITKTAPKRIHKDQAAVRIVFCVAARGTTSMAAVVLLIVVGTTLLARAAAAGFVLSRTKTLSFPEGMSLPFKVKRQLESGKMEKWKNGIME